MLRGQRVLIVGSVTGRCCSAYSLHCSIVWVVSWNALGISELEGRAEELDARGTRTVGVFVIFILVWEHAKEERRTYAEES